VVWVLNSCAKTIKWYLYEVKSLRFEKCPYCTKCPSILQKWFVQVKAPWLRTFFYGDLDTYIIPGMDSVTLGGCRQYESWDVQINKFDSMRIKEQCEGLLPGLKNCEVLGHKVGLRPHRGIVRVEKELIQINGKTVKLVHNYGHGGYGVTTAPGTSLHACQLVQEILSGNSKL